LSIENIQAGCSDAGSVRRIFGKEVIGKSGEIMLSQMVINTSNKKVSCLGSSCAVIITTACELFKNCVKDFCKKMKNDWGYFLS